MSSTPWTKYAPQPEQSGPWAKYGDKPATTGGTPISDSDSSTIGPSKSSALKSAAADPFKVLDITKPIENYTQEGRKEHPVLSRVGDVTSGLKEFLFGGKSVGKPMGTSAGAADAA